MNESVSIAIIDDEPKVRDTIIGILEHAGLDCRIAGQAESVETAYALICQKKPDLVLLDINLPDGSGFDLLNKFDRIHFGLIFITAYEEYAIKAFKVNALDYLLKPFKSYELIETINRAIAKLRHTTTDQQLTAFLSGLKQTKKIVVRTAVSMHIINVQDIIRLEADGNYTRFCLCSGEKLLVSKTLKEYEEQLTESGFIRVHQSHLVNLDHVLRYDKADGGFLVLTDHSSVPIASRKRDLLLKYLEEL